MRGLTSYFKRLNLVTFIYHIMPKNILDEYKSILQANLINLLGLELLPEDKKMEILERAMELTEKRVMLRVLDELKAKDREAAEEAAKGGKMLEFIQARVPNLAEIVAEETARVKIELMDAQGTNA